MTRDVERRDVERSDVEPSGVEFVVEETDDATVGADDVLDAGQPRRIPRIVWPVVLVIALTGAVLLAVRQGGSSHPNARPPATITLTQFPSVPALPGPVRPVPACHGPGVCVDTPTVPKDVATAVAHYVPHAMTTAVSSALREGVLAGNALLQSRRIEAHLGAAELLIRIRPYRHQTASPKPTTPLTETPPGLASAFLHLETPGYIIDMQWVGPETSPPPMDGLRELADDPRLESVQ